MTTDPMSTESVSDEYASVAAFWAAHRLLHRAEALNAFLGTETPGDLDDVRPGDLETAHARHWLEAHLAIAEANRLRRAVAEHHARSECPRLGRTYSFVGPEELGAPPGV